MTIVINLTWHGLAEFALWVIGLSLGAYLLSRCYVAFRTYRYKANKKGES